MCKPQNSFSYSQYTSFPVPTSEGRKEMFYLTMHSTHFIYGYMASDIWLRTILIVRKETHCCHIGYSFRLTARVLLYAPSHRQDSTYHSLCYTSHGALAGMRNSFQLVLHIYLCMCACVCVCVCIYIYIYIYIYTHTHIYTHICIYIYVCVCMHRVYI